MILTVLRFLGTSDRIRFAGIFCDDATMALVYFPTLVDPCQGVTSRGVTLFYRGVNDHDDKLNPLYCLFLLDNAKAVQMLFGAANRR